MTGTTSTARNRLDAEQSASALCRELSWDDGAAPEWIQLMPIGPAVDGRDGRSWTMSDPEAVVRDTTLPMVLDWEHSTEIKAPKGDEAPAAAWLVELDVVREESAGRTPGIWGRVDWTPRGASSVRSREYRFVSPVFQHTKGENEVLRLLNAALTNRPNLDLTALNGRESRPTATPSEEAKVMNPKQLAALCAVLGIPADSSAEAITEAAQNARATPANATVESNGTMVPVTDLTAALNRAQVAEGKLAALETTQHKANVEAALNAAQAAGKVSPASRAHYEAMCSDAAGLERFKALVETLPSLNASTTPVVVTGEQSGNAANTLSAEDKATAKALNISEEDFRSFKASNTQQENG